MNERALYEDPQLPAQRFFQIRTRQHVGTHSYPGLKGTVRNAPNETRTPPCRLGEHSTYVYSDRLGCSVEEIQRLETAGHIDTEDASQLH